MALSMGLLGASAFLEPAGSFDLLDERVLASAESSVVFSSLSTYAADYQHLQIRMAIRDNRSGVSISGSILRFNGDSGSNYAQHLLQGDGSSVLSQGQASQSGILRVLQSSLSATANNFAANTIDILDPFETTKYTTARLVNGNAEGASSRIRLTSGLWMNTASLTSISFTPEASASFATGSRFSLYGIRGS